MHLRGRDAFLESSQSTRLYKVNRINGGGWQQTRLCQNYFGSTIIAQAAEVGWKPPLTTGISTTWHAAHRYGGPDISGAARRHTSVKE